MCLCRVQQGQYYYLGILTSMRETQVARVACHCYGIYIYVKVENYRAATVDARGTRQQCKCTQEVEVIQCESEAMTCVDGGRKASCYDESAPFGV